MKPSDELFLLIKSMSQKERNFFRRRYNLLTEDADGNYLKLFNNISRQAENGNVYDESDVRNDDYSGKFIKNFPFHKNYLYNIVLDSIYLANDNSTESYEIRELISKAEMLTKRLLYDQSLKILYKAKKLAVENEKFSMLYEIINIEKNIIRYTLGVDDSVKKYEELFEEQITAVEKMKNLTEYYKLNELTGNFLRRYGSGKIRGKEMMKDFDSIFESPLLKNRDMATTFMSKYIFHNLNLQYHLTNEDHKQAYIHAKSAVELFETNSRRARSHSDNYVYSLSNLLNCQIRTKKFGEFDATADKLAKCKQEAVSNLIKVFIFYSLSVMRLSKNMEQLNKSELERISEEISKEVPEYEEAITLYQRIILFYFLITSNFMLEKYDACIYWNSKILNIGKSDLSEDYQCYARLIQLISYFELGYIDSVEYALKSVYHFISRKKKVYKYESIIQKYLRNSFKIKTEKELKQMFIEMRDEVVKLQKDPFERNALDAFNILPWLEKRIGKR